MEAKLIPNDEERRFLSIINKMLSSAKGGVPFLALLEVIRHEERSCSCKHAYERDYKLLERLLDSPEYTVIISTRNTLAAFLSHGAIKHDVWLTENYAKHLSKKKKARK